MRGVQDGRTLPICGVSLCFMAKTGNNTVF